MKVVIATPLYPPDIADPAPYVKELALRLTVGHDVTIVTYGKLPETVPGVLILATDKRLPAPLRLLRFTWSLLLSLPRTDLLYVQSGISAELPALIARFFFGTTLLFRKSAEPPMRGFLRSAVRSYFEKRAHVIPPDAALIKPEILPFQDRPVAELKRFESAWAEHVEELLNKS